MSGTETGDSANTQDSRVKSHPAVGSGAVQREWCNKGDILRILPDKLFVPRYPLLIFSGIDTKAGYAVQGKSSGPELKT